MRELSSLDASVLQEFGSVDERKVEEALSKELSRLNRKILVLDDDPTGGQTVHGVSEYTDWEEETIREGFLEDNSLFYILTNSRGMQKEQTAEVHRTVARNIVSASKSTGRDFVLVSRGDSTLRGHYPLETETLKSEIEKLTDRRFDGEIILPFFKEGGRFTIDDIQYVKEKDRLVPAGQTEFSRDKTFGYVSSHLGDWCEEKTGGAYRADRMIYISLREVRACAFGKIESRLMGARDFNKVIVNAADYIDVKVFAVALARALAKGKEFILRSAASATKVLGGIPDRPLLTKGELVEEGGTNGGVILVGSHVNKTTLQLEELRNCRLPIEFIEFNQHLVRKEGGLAGEVRRIVSVMEEKIRSGRTVAVYTRRDRIDLESDDRDAQLFLSAQISDAVTGLIGALTVRPGFIITKGGMTSSDVATKALRVRRAAVMGQIKPGVPVWMTDSGSKFPNMPYVVFPGNVGENTTLREVAESLMS